MNEKTYIVVDLGGTNLRVAAMNQEGQVLSKTKTSSDSKSDTLSVMNKITALIHDVAKPYQDRVVGVTLGFPGIVDPEKGIVYQSPHFPDWKNLDLRTHFSKTLTWPLVIDNDANLAALGEAWKGAGSSLKNFIMLTFGTGVGGGIIIDRKLFHGDHGFAGELGHMCVEASEGLSCACGSRGCWEMYVSTQGILKFFESVDDHSGRQAFMEKFNLNSVGRVTVKHLYEAALDGDIFAGVIFRKMGHYLGIGLASIANAFGIENLVLGGGISEAWDFFVDVARKEIQNRTYHETAKRIQLHKALLGDDAALVGGVAAHHFNKI